MLKSNLPTTESQNNKELDVITKPSLRNLKKKQERDQNLVPRRTQPIRKA